MKVGSRTPSFKENWNNRSNYIQLYIPSRVAIVLIAEENVSKYDSLKEFSENHITIEKKDVKA